MRDTILEAFSGLPTPSGYEWDVVEKDGKIYTSLGDGRGNFWAKDQGKTTSLPPLNQIIEFAVLMLRKRFGEEWYQTQGVGR